jgi:hypothetical protein
VKTLRRSRPRVEFCCDDPNLTPAAGLAAVAELDRVVGIAQRIDAAVGRLASARARGRPFGASDVVLGFAESQLAGGDFMVDIDTRRGDTAGASLRAIANPPASTTAAALARRVGAKGVVRLSRCLGELAQAFFQHLPEPERSRLVLIRPTIDIDPTEVEAYGHDKEGFAWNHQGQWAARPLPIVWAEAGLVLHAKLLSAKQDPRPHARRMITRALGSLPAGLGTPRVRIDSGFFDGSLAGVCLDAGADYAVSVPRNPAFWSAVRAVPADAWVVAKGMDNAEVAEASYHPKGWPGAPRAIVRRVRVEKQDVRSDTRSRRLKTIDPIELAELRAGRRDHVHAYSMILTSLEDETTGLEHWFRRRGQVEERLKDSKHGAALRHLPSGYKVVNAVWMLSAFLALDISAVLSAFARHSERDGSEENGGEEHGGDERCGTDALPDRRPRPRQPLRAHGKRLRREIVNVPGRLAHHAGALVVHLHPSNQAGPLVRVYELLVALPSWSGP